MKRIHPLVLTATAAMILLSGCSANQDTQPAQNTTPKSQDTHAGHGHTATPQTEAPALAANQTRLPNGDIQEPTASVEEMPKFLATKDPTIVQIYALAAHNVDTLKYMPCYCGCGEEAGHKSNADCFVADVKEDGTIIWDDHGTRCGTCMEIAVESSKLKEEGKTLREIRDHIDTKYKDDYAKPTPTPMPF